MNDCATDMNTHRAIVFPGGSRHFHARAKPA
jgi:hypothetical protein